MQKRYFTANYSPGQHLHLGSLDEETQLSDPTAIPTPASLRLTEFVARGLPPSAALTAPSPLLPFLGTTSCDPLRLASLQNCLNDQEKKTTTLQYILLWQNYWFKSHTIARYYLKVNPRKMSLHPNRAELICHESVMMCLFPHWGVYIFQEDRTVYLQVKSALKWEF